MIEQQPLEQIKLFLNQESYEEAIAYLNFFRTTDRLNLNLNL
jgi:hypothetical protein